MMKRIMILLMMLGSASLPLYARLKEARSERSLDKIIGAHPFAVVLFYSMDKDEKRDREQRNFIESIKTIVEGVSQTDKYKKADIAFVAVNTARSQLNNVLNIYNVKEVPSLFIFKSGQAVRAGDNKVQVTTITRKNVFDVIETYLKKDIAAYLKHKAKERARRAYERSLYGPYFYYGVGYPYYNPWYYNPYYYPYGGISFGFSI